MYVYLIICLRSIFAGPSSWVCFSKAAQSNLIYATALGRTQSTPASPL